MCRPLPLCPHVGVRAAVAAIAVVVAAGCPGRDDLDGRRRPIPGLEGGGSAYELDLGAAAPVFDLYDNRAAAISYTDGALVIEAGTADMAKYISGGYGNPWHLQATDSGRRAALVYGQAGSMSVPADGAGDGIEPGPGGGVTISLFARAAQPDQLVSVFVDERRVGDIAMPTTEWQRYAVEVPADIWPKTAPAGEHGVRLYFRHTGELDGRRSAAAIARVRIGRPGPVEQAPYRAGPVVRAGARLDALQVTGPARLSYYLTVPDASAALVFAHARPDAGETALAVRVARSGQGVQERWQGRAGPNWQPARIELGDLAGEVVRIDLVSAGPADWGRPRLVAPAPAAAPSPDRPAVDHIIMWVVSALRADRVDAGRVPTPGFARLAARGLRFENAVSAAPSPAPAHVALLSGRHPASDELPAEVDTVAERLTAAGYATTLISGNGFVNDERGFARGFAVYDNPMRRRHPFHARVLWQRARQVLKRRAGGRSFTVVVTVEPHLPYMPSPESLAAEWTGGPVRFEPVDTIALAEAVAAGRERLSSDERDYVRALYDGEVRDADAAFAAMLDDLVELGLADRTAVVLVGDHGEELWERGGFGHGSHLHQEVLRVPLILAWTGVSPGTRADPVSLVDLVPTVLDLAGTPADPLLPGRSLLAPPGPDDLLPAPVFSHLPGRARAVIAGSYKLVVPLRGRPALYDLGADPGERQDLAGQRPLVERYLHNLFGLGVAYQDVWSRRRWGHPGNLRAAFSADHGL
ncbi:sulfatase-like hydrolase/transferase [Haliangium sp.]|uniref:sulfatase-like hydrolase/transferase n=1 Tax=Haliangium sp. TaxID=2663208 RepID=UPI003D12B452